MAAFRTLPYIPSVIALVYAPLAFVFAILLAIFFPAKRSAMEKVALWGCATLAVLLLLATIFHFDFANWLGARLFYFAFVAFIGVIFDHRTLVNKSCLAFLEACRTRANVGVEIGAALAAVLFIWPLLPKALSGAAFGDAAQILHFGGVGFSLAAHLSIWTVLLDALAGGCLMFALLRARNVGVPASLFGAIAWMVAGARVAPQGFGFQVTAFLPAALIIWEKLAAKSYFLFFVVSIAVALVSPQIFIPMMIVIAADNYSRAFPNGRFGSVLALSFVVGCAIFIAKVAVFSPTQFIAGPLADPILRINGGDGAYPWEWLYPSPVSANFTNFAYAAQAVTAHFGNAWQACVSSGWAVLVPALAAIPQLMRRRPDLRRFAVFAVALSIYAALPSHLYGLPIPDLALVGPALNQWLTTGAYSGLAGILALCYLAAFEIDVLLQARGWGKALLVYLSLILLLIGAPLSPGIFWNPDGASLTNQLRGANYACGEIIGLVPGYAGDDPIERTNRVSVLAAFGSLSGQSTVRSVSLRDVSAKSPIHCFVVDYDEIGRYAFGPASNALLLPASLSAIPVEEEPALARYMLPGFRIVSLDGRIFVYRRSP